MKATRIADWGRAGRWWHPALLALWLAGATAGDGEARLGLAQRWVYYQGNLVRNASCEELQAVMRRTARAGYTGVLLADSKFSRLDQMEPGYFRNVDRVKALAAELKLEIIPAVFPMGWAEGLLAHDPNLAEALPVRDALFVVSNGLARCVADPPISFPGGGFADLAAWDMTDPAVVADHGTARMTDPQGNHARVMQKLRVHPFHQYHISVRIKTQDFRGTAEIKVLTGNRVAGWHALNYGSLGVKPTEDWTVHHAVFNSLDNDQVAVYFGCWDGRTGSLWWAEPKIEEAGLLNVVRRAGAPLAVKLEDGRALVEGRNFAPVADPRLGTEPWRGMYEVWHAPPPLRTKLPEGTRLRGSFYHAITIGDGQVVICPSEPQTVALLRDQARRLHAAWGAKGYFLWHDEIRVLNWDESCARRHLNAGAILADNVRTCVRILRDVNPGGAIYAWNDMFDPHHNAHQNYYLVRGDLTGSWAGLDQDVIIGNWNAGQRQASLKWFANRGQRQMIAGYFDSPPEQVRPWLEAARTVPGVVGVIYTTWQHHYDDLERFAQIVDEYR